jgi:hypothetical protein
VRRVAWVFLTVAFAFVDACTSKSGDSPAAPPLPPASVPVLASINVTLGVTSLLAGKSTTASASGANAAGVSIALSAVAWTSTNPAVATVSSSGNVYAASAGRTLIVAAVGGKQGQVSLDVKIGTPAQLSTSVASDPVSRRELFGAGLSRGLISWNRGDVASTVSALDASGAPLAGIPITFHVNSRYLTFVLASDSTRLTDSTGRVRVPTLHAVGPATPHLLSAAGFAGNGDAQPFTVTAPGVGDTLRFSFTVIAGNPARISATKDTILGQFLAGEFIGREPTVVVRDAFGNVRWEPNIVWRTVEGNGLLVKDDLPSTMWFLGAGPNSVEASIPAFPDAGVVRFHAVGDTAIGSKLPVGVTISFPSVNARAWELAVRNAVGRYSQFITQPFAAVDVSLAAGVYGQPDMPASEVPAIALTGWQGLHMIVMRSATISTLAGGTLVRRADGTPAVGVIWLNRSLVDSMERSLMRGGNTLSGAPYRPSAWIRALVHEVGHALGAVGTSTRNSSFVTGGSNPSFQSPAPWTFWRSVLPGKWSANGIPLNSSAPGHWMSGLIGDIMADIGTDAVTSLTAYTLRDAGVPISLAAVDSFSVTPADVTVSLELRIPLLPSLTRGMNGAVKNLSCSGVIPTQFQVMRNGELIRQW